ncbi:MAG: alpha/beta fold hydrolase [Gammaproteobacteria bacterium]|nr:MAG: alpha/beta fold hydrolase [Chloroflexota bacterium]TDJ22677.1 MAG: alpha/beta fold hydrolase [Gammaproteobacteria bacterium]TDJ37513.1 MAG: alpha/beta fold hydrolase [Gammaproteobacteria bacterium]
MHLDRIEVTTGESPDAAVIWLHGLGADGSDFEAIVPELQLPADLALRFVFPHAPERAVAINSGMQMRAWYDVDPSSPLSGGDDIRESAQAVAQLLDEQRKLGIASSRIILAGFSQGGVIALHLGLRHAQPLAGIMGLSTYLHDPERLTEELGLANIDTPILLAHGLMDPMIPITRAITSREALIALDYPVEWHEYSMGHQVCTEEIQDISSWLTRCLTRA